jgi:hypothetical protein
MKYSITGSIAIILLIFTILLSGCVGEQLSSGDGSGGKTAPATGYEGRDSAPTNSYTGTQGTSSTSDNAYTNIADRKVIMTGNIQIETTEFDKAVNEIRKITAGYGGYIESSSTYTYEKDRRVSTITMKVPQSAFEAAFAQVKNLGKVKSEQTSGQDVTRQFIDLSARLKNLKAEEEKLVEIMNRAMTVSDILQVEKELSRVRYEIESTTAQLNYLSSRVEFATITVTVSEPEPVVSSGWGLEEAFREAVRAFVGMIGGLIVVTGYLIPLVLYCALVLVILYLLVKALLELYKRYIKKKS